MKKQPRIFVMKKTSLKAENAAIINLKYEIETNIYNFFNMIKCYQIAFF